MKTWISRWILPPGIRDVVSRLVRGRPVGRYTERQAWKKLIEPNRKLRGLIKGQPVFVLANGSSLAGVDLEQIGKYNCITMNFFGRTKGAAFVRPLVHCACDPVESFSGNDHLKEILSGTIPDFYFLRAEVEPLVARIEGLDISKVRYVLNDGLFSEGSAIELSDVVPWTPDTSVLAVMVAIHLGADPIYLLGVDYDRCSHRGEVAHSYPSSGDLTGRDERLSDRSYSSVVYWMWRSLIAHDCLNKIARRQGQAIINLTDGSFLDVYERRSLTAVIG